MEEKKKRGPAKVLSERVHRTFILEQKHVDMLAKYAWTENCSLSEAVRSMIERGCMFDSDKKS